MRKLRFKESEIVLILKEVEVKRNVRAVCREIGISKAMYYTIGRRSTMAWMFLS